MVALTVNLSVPSRAVEAAALPIDGVGLLRSEFLLSRLGQHPSRLDDDRILGHLTAGLRTVAAAFHPRPVVHRALDAKSNEMRSLLSGADAEPLEENPSLGLRGASRILHDPRYFLLECRALLSVRGEGLDNLHLMIPFVRVADEARACWDLLAPLVRHDPGLRLWLMAEVPAFVDEIAGVSGFTWGLSIGTNDLTQLLYGADRDNPAVARHYADTGATVLRHVTELVTTAHQHGLRATVCGDAPSRSEETFDRLIEIGVDGISVSLDAVSPMRARLDRLAASSGLEAHHGQLS